MEDFWRTLDRFHSKIRGEIDWRSRENITLHVFIAVLFGYAILRLILRLTRVKDSPRRVAFPEPEQEPEPMRNFTAEQLKKFNGLDSDGKEDNDVPIYVSLRGQVFDVSSARHAYGKNGNYHMFAGCDASINLAKNSLDESDLGLTNWNDLSFAEKDSLDHWIIQFRDYKCYPIVGRLVTTPLPDPLPVFTKEELEAGKGEGTDSTEHIVPPIYVAVNGKVYDVSYGGGAHYSKGMSYHLFAGRDASRALAKMSFNAEHLDNPTIKDLDDSELKVLEDWDARFEKKGYRVVGLYPTT